MALEYALRYPDRLSHLVLLDTAGDPRWRDGLRSMAHGGWRMRIRPEVLIFAHRRLIPGWTAIDRLSEITVPTLVMAGRADFIFPPTSQRELAGGLPHAQLRLIDEAGHNPHDEQTDVVMREVRHFITTPASA